MDFKTQDKPRGGTHKMLSRLRKRFTYANVAMTLALVFAMTGGAYAASKYLITSTKQISPKVLKQLQGRAGTAGAQGAAGPAGVAGAKGENGAPGKEGPEGKEGKEGKAGVSVASSVEPKGLNCKEGGSKFVAASGTTFACNGEKGKEGSFGSGQSLPSGQTLRGAYGASGFSSESFGKPGMGLAVTGVSLALPIASQPKNVIYVKENETTPAGCKGGVQDPGAEPGNLCVFAESETNVERGLFGALPPVEPIGGSTVTIGFSVRVAGASPGRIAVTGTWAVTAE